MRPCPQGHISNTEEDPMDDNERLEAQARAAEQREREQQRDQQHLQERLNLLLREFRL